ncbi:MAG TPA: ABC transporter permease [Solirubrobacteraceae bacterium]|jgi:putative ABC transport system permease protein
MTRLILRDLAARRLRTALTALAIVLGVAMISAALTVGDTMRRGADSLSSDSYGGTAAVVSQKTLFESDFESRKPVPASTLDTVRRVPQVGVAVGDVLDEARIVDGKGDVVGQGPYFGVGFDAATPGAEKVSPFRLKQGRWATGPGQVVIDQGTAEKQGYAVGDRIRISTRGPATRFEIVGLATFGSVKSLGVATVAVFDLRAAQAMYGRGDGYDDILVGGRGAPAPEVRAAVARAVPALQVQSAAKNDRFELDNLKMFVGIIRTVLLVFGGVAILVGAFTIVNTLSITVAQRTRELALLRALGARRGQVLRSVVGEAFVIGAAASAIGVAAGFGLAGGITALFGAIGLELPQAGTVFAASTVIVGIGVGTVVTALAGLIPARRATRVAPVSVMREGGAEAREPGRIGRAVRAVVGVVCRPATRLGGVAGRLARGNAMRVPGRTLATASALTVGVSLVAAVAVIGHGLKSSAIDTQKHRIAADYVMVGSDGWSPVDPKALDALAEVPGVTDVTGIKQDEARSFGEKAMVAAVDPKAIGAVMRHDWKAGSDATLADLGGDGAIVRSDFATKHDLKVGSRFAVKSRSGDSLDLVVRGIERKPRTDLVGLGQITVARSTFAQAFSVPRNWISFVAVDGGASAATKKALDAALSRFPEAKVSTADAFVEDNAKFIDQLLGVFYVLLALAVIVSLFGIVNTLVLSVFERTRELGMLRAIGMTRRQVRRMIRHESIITALLGAFLGIAIGLALAAVVTTAFADQGFVFAIPAGTMIAVVVIAIVAGVAAAALPARRAARLQPLSALAYE